MDLEPSPFCHYQTSCGACELMPLSYAKQLEQKAQALQDLLSLDEKPSIIASPKISEFRHRVMLRVHIDHQAIKVGYFAKGSRTLLPIDACTIAEPAINVFLHQLYAAKCPIDQPMKCRLLVHARSDDLGVDIQVTPVNEGLSRVSTEAFMRWINALPGVRRAAVASKDLLSSAAAEPLTEGVNLYTSPPAFSQTNPGINRLIQLQIKDWAIAHAVSSVLDLHCGNGNLSLGLVGNVTSLAFSDISDAALALLGRSLAALRTNTQFSVGKLSAEKAVAVWSTAAQTFELVIVDPPRTGLGKTARDLKQVSGKYLIYLSCHQESLKADLEVLKKDFTLNQVKAYDMFPHTTHLEVLCLLTKKRNS